MKISVINGPNLNLLGTRDPDHYGNQSLKEIEDGLKQAFPEIQFHFFQSNIEGEIINWIQSLVNNYDGIIINPGGYAHTSVAIRDALIDIGIPRIEVHLSNIAAREDFRQTLLTASACNGYISGFKEKSYYAGVVLLKSIIEDKGGKI
jgi:3-dehydroquinate dehydratase-2